MIRSWAKVAFLAAVTLLAAQESSKTPAGSLTIDDVVRLVKAGMSEDLIIGKVKQNGKPFDLNADEMVELKRSGVSDTIIRYMMNPTLPYTPPQPPPATPAPAATPLAAAAPKPPSDPLALKVPAEPGIYLLTANQEFAPLDLKPVVPSKQPGKVPSMLSGGLVKGHTIGSVVGASAKTRIPASGATLYIRLPEKASIDDFALLSLETQKTRRNLDFGTKPGTPVFPVKSVMPFQSKEAMPALYKLNVTLTHRGEYLFFILGSGDDKKGLLGKGYDFGVE
jgi:hypothetical protein